MSTSTERKVEWRETRCVVCGGSFLYDVARDCPPTCGQLLCIARGTWPLSRWEGQWRMAEARAACGIAPQPLDVDAAVKLGRSLPAPPAPGPSTKRRLRRYAERPTEWVTLGPRATLATFLARKVGVGSERVYVCGPEPGGGGIAGLRRWVFGKMPAGWSAGAHYLDDTAAPVLRFTRPDGRRLDVYRAAQWFGEDATPAAAEAAMGTVEGELRRTFGCGPLATPGTTGRELFARSIPEGVEWPTLPDEVQELIRSSSGQGRIEACPAVERVSRVVELDGRLMYAALCNELGAGPVTHDRGGQYLGYQPARYRVRFSVPDDWAHVGILPVKDDAGGWHYPSVPGTSWETWADGAELHIAHKYGWRTLILERLVYTKGRPLDRWAQLLVDIAQRHAEDVLVRSAVRAILLHAIGAFHGRPHVVTRSVTSERSREIPTGTRDVQRIAGGPLIWQEHQPPAWPEMSHPEWSARVWARARARLLEGPGNTGALHVPRQHVLGFLTDAIYLQADPAWPDDGRPGRYRLTTNLELVEAPAPRNHLELISLKGHQ